MTSVLESDYIKPTRPYSSNELSDMRNNFFKKINLSNVIASHKNCKHFYYVKENGRKEKELNENNNVGNCSCCWKLSKTPNDLFQKAEELVNIYSTKFKEYPSTLNYDLLDVEICFYKWLYVDKYEFSENRNFKKNNNQRKNLKVNTNM